MCVEAFKVSSGSQRLQKRKMHIFGCRFFVVSLEYYQNSTKCWELKFISKTDRQICCSEIRADRQKLYNHTRTLFFYFYLFLFIDLFTSQCLCFFSFLVLLSLYSFGSLFSFSLPLSLSYFFLPFLLPVFPSFKAHELEVHVTYLIDWVLLCISDNKMYISSCLDSKIKVV
jgi:hypothetical protein